jgi:hypothetical protein
MPEMAGLAEKSRAELEALVADLGERIARNPQGSAQERIELGDVKWELEKRDWRKL